jgi:hypothetical protein
LPARRSAELAGDFYHNYFLISLFSREKKERKNREKRKKERRRKKA